MDKKIAFFDIDGTLVNVENGLMHPTKETMRVLKEFKELGHEIIVATARTSAPKSVADIDFDGYIFNDGHYMTYKNEVLVDDTFTTKDIEKQISIYKRHQGRYMFSGQTGTWNSFLDDAYMIQHREMFEGTSKRPTNCIENYQPHEVSAIACCVLFATLEDLEACYNELKEEFAMSVYRTGLIRMDVYRKGFEKGSACEYLYQQVNIPKENTYAFGDGINDIEMIKRVGHGIAMGNALESVKEVADDITDTVDNDGISKAFNKYFDI